MVLIGDSHDLNIFEVEQGFYMLAGNVPGTDKPNSCFCIIRYVSRLSGVPVR